MWYSRLSSQSQLKLDSSQVINDPLNTKQCPEQCQVRRRCRHSSLAMSGCTWVSLSSFYRDSNQCLVLIVSQSDRRSYKAIKPGIVPGTPSQPSLPCPGSGTSPHLYCLLLLTGHHLKKWRLPICPRSELRAESHYKKGVKNVGQYCGLWL